MCQFAGDAVIEQYPVGKSGQGIVVSMVLHATGNRFGLFLGQFKLLVGNFELPGALCHALFQL